MSKSGPISKEEKAYLKKYYKKLSPDAMANKIDRKPATVKKYVEKLIEEETKDMVDTVEEEVSEVKNDLSYQLMGKTGTGAVTMTEAASMQADEALKRQKKMPSSRYKNCIKILNKDKEIR